MPIRPIVCGLAAIAAASLASPADAQYRRPAYRRPAEFVPGPAVAQQSMINPEHEKIKIRAQELYRKQDYKRAITLVNSVLRLAKTDAVALYIRASARIDLGLREKDVELVREGIADARNSVSQGSEKDSGAVYYVPYLHGMIGLAKLENRPEHAEVAVQVAEQVLGLPNVKATEKANLHFQRAAALSLLARHEEAAKEYESAIEIDNSHIGAYIALAGAYAKAEKHDEASKAYDTAVEAFTNSALVRNNRGSYRRGRGDLRGAVEDFTEAIEIDSQFTVGYVNRGFTRMQLGDYAGAERDLDRALQLDSSRTNAYELRGQARIAQGQLARGIEDHEQVVTRSPKYAGGFANLGFARFFAGEYEPALTAFDQAVEIDPGLKYLDTWRLMCMVLLDRTETAEETFEDTFTKDEEKRDWVDQLLVYLAEKQSVEQLLAAVDTKDEKRSDQQSCEANFVIAVKLRHEGDEQAADEHLAKVLESNANYLAAYRGAQYQLNRFDVAEQPTDAVRN